MLGKYAEAKIDLSGQDNLFSSKVKREETDCKKQLNNLQKVELTNARYG
jgi:hypothetical protein